MEIEELMSRVTQGPLVPKERRVNQVSQVLMVNKVALEILDQLESTDYLDPLVCSFMLNFSCTANKL